MAGKNAANATAVAAVIVVILLIIMTSGYAYRAGYSRRASSLARAAEQGDCLPADRYIGPAIWGPPFWSTLYNVASGLCPARREAFRQYYKLVPYVLPCAECGEKFQTLLKKRPIDYYLDSREQLLKWVWLQHMDVRKHQKVKTVPDFTLADVYTRYLPADAQQKETRQQTAHLVH